MGRVLQPFEYYEPVTVADAARLTRSANAHLLAGGCDLVPRMRHGLVRPERVVSIMKVAELDDVPRLGPDGELRIGARVLLGALGGHPGLPRWHALDDAVDGLEPADIRNMGTVVGNVCSAVAFLDVPVVLAVLRAELRVTDGSDARAIPVADLCVAPLTTALRPGELVSSIVVPAVGPHSGSAFGKIAVTPHEEGDHNRVSAACSVVLDAGGTSVASMAVVIGSCDFRPLPVPLTTGFPMPVGAATYAQVAALAADMVAPPADAHWAAQVRPQLVAALVRDGLERAVRRAGGPAEADDQRRQR